MNRYATLLYDLHLAWRNIAARRIQTAITIAVMGMALALFVATAALGAGVRQGVIQASDPFGVLVIGPKGSAQQLVLNTILLQGTPIGAIEYSLYERLSQDPRVALAVPIAMADNVGGARIIGVSTAFFELKRAENEPPAFQVAAGRLFESDFEAVLGANSAAALGLGLGEQFAATHGVERGLAQDVHDEVPFTVVGILHPTHTPYDNAVFVSVASVWAAHEEHEEEEHEEETPPTSLPTADIGAAEHDELTAVLVKLAALGDANTLWQEFFLGAEAQAAFPGQELSGLFDLLRQGERALTVVGYVAAVMAALTVLLSVYSATLAREQTIAIMRGLGAGRLSIVRMVLAEALIVSLLGALCARLLGYGAAFLIAQGVASQSAIPIPIAIVGSIELFLWLLPTVLGLAAGVLPALMAYRVNVVDKLFAQ